MTGPDKEEGYAGDAHVPGRSREVDAIAHAAAAECSSNPAGFKVNDEDPANTQEEPCGNPANPQYSNKRSIGGSK